LTISKKRTGQHIISGLTFKSIVLYVISFLIVALKLLLLTIGETIDNRMNRGNNFNAAIILLFHYINFRKMLTLYLGDFEPQHNDH
jgi:hypothetical protein